MHGDNAYIIVSGCSTCTYSSDNRDFYIKISVCQQNEVDHGLGAPSPPLQPALIDVGLLNKRRLRLRDLRVILTLKTTLTDDMHGRKELFV